MDPRIRWKVHGIPERCKKWAVLNKNDDIQKKFAKLTNSVYHLVQPNHLQADPAQISPFWPPETPRHSPGPALQNDLHAAGALARHPSRPGPPVARQAQGPDQSRLLPGTTSYISWLRPSRGGTAEPGGLGAGAMMPQFFA